jgi:hypothetical protein
MKKFLCLGIFIVTGAAAMLPVSASSSSSRQYVPATVLQVEKHEAGSPAYTGGDNPSDAPLRSEYYAYEVSVRVDCEPTSPIRKPLLNINIFSPCPSLGLLPDAVIYAPALLFGRFFPTLG